MNKRKMTSIALAAAVAISTVQLAYPANVFAQEQVNEINIKNIKNKDYIIKENEYVNGEITLDFTKEDTQISGNNWKYDRVNNLLELNGVNITGTIKLPEGAKVIVKGKNTIVSKSDTNHTIYSDGDFSIEGEGKENSCLEVRNTLEVKDGNNISYKKNAITSSSNVNIKNCTILLAGRNGINAKKIKIEGSNIKTDELKTNPDNVAGHIYGTVFTINAYSDTTDASIDIKNSVVEGNATYYSIRTFANCDKSSILNIDNCKMQLEPGASSAISVVGNGTESNLNILNSNDILIKSNPSNAIEITNNNGVSKLNINNSRVSGHGQDYGIITKSKNKSEINIIGNSEVISTASHKSGLVLESSGKNVLNISSHKDVKVGPNESEVVTVGTLEYSSDIADRVFITSKGNLAFTSKNDDEKNLPHPIKNKNIFMGWYDDGNISEKEWIGNEDFSGKPIDTAKKGNKYYAKWNELKDINLVHDGDGNEETNTSETISLGTATSLKSSNESIVKVDGSTIKAIGLGTAIIKYIDAESNVIGQQNVTVTKPNGTIATIGNIPYTDLQTAITNAKEGDTIVLEEGNDTINISKTLEINNNKNNITIDFKGRTLSSNSGYTDESLIKITNSTGIKVINANFDLSNGGDVAILVEGTSEVSLEGKITSKKNNSDKAPVISLVGEGAKATLTEGSTINGKLDPDSELIITDENSKNNFTNENNTSSGGGSVPSIPSKPSKPTYTHEKIEGLDRYETAAKIADKLGSYDTAVLVNATSTMSDGLSAAGLAGKEDAAILLVKKDSIPKATMDRLKKVKKVYIIGGENAISKKVSDEITKNVSKVEVERLGGKTRVETSELVAKEIGNYSNAFIVNGFKGEADAMSASAVAARYGAPILLTNGKTSTHAKKSGVEYYVVGGTSVVNKSIADKYNAKVLAGKDRYATNREVINEFYSGSDKLYIANGDKLVDALTASPLAKNHGIVLVNKKSDKSILKEKNTVQVGGMDFEIDFDK